MPPPPPALPTHGRPMERLTARNAVETASARTPRSRRWTVEIGVTLMLLDLLYWIRR